MCSPSSPRTQTRALRYQGFTMYSESRTGVVGHDCVPLTAAETCVDGLAYGFSCYLAALARVDRIATVSQASAVEYMGWRAMLSGTGLHGPEIHAIPLAVVRHDPTPSALVEAKNLFGLGSMPIVLAVGSHEPRKNHLAALHAAEILWREGIPFTFAFIGANSWHSSTFEVAVADLQNQGRPLQVAVRLSEELLWAAYRLAWCTIFPSLHEGFGLPVAESLASGTPVITSSYGSMREIGASGGALLVDPRDDLDLAAALRRMLTEEGLRERLASEAASVPTRSWDEYADETWAFLVDGVPPRG